MNWRGKLLPPLLALVACNAAEKANPCPRGIGVGSATTPDGGGSTTEMPERACAESWNCTSWAAGSEGKYSRVCMDANGCGTTTAKPQEGPITLPALDLQ